MAAEYEEHGESLPDDFVQDIQDNLSYSGRESSVEQHLSEVVAGWNVVKTTVQDETTLPYMLICLRMILQHLIALTIRKTMSLAIRQLIVL